MTEMLVVNMFFFHFVNHLFLVPFFTAEFRLNAFKMACKLTIKSNAFIVTFWTDKFVC